jgi:hypothetical protein
MFTNNVINNYLETSNSISTISKVTAEWNFNNPENISSVGNYRYRPLESNSLYNIINNTYDPNDYGNFYTNATDADIEIDGGFNNLDEPQIFISKKDKEKQLNSLESCFEKFRPRSGINKIRYFNNNYLHNTNQYLAVRPRYYMHSNKDLFKYWTSYRTENNKERGIATNIQNGQNFIDDVAPFVIYNKSVPTNKIVIKMQTHVGTKNLGPFNTIYGEIDDPFYGYSNQTTPISWKVQKLINNNWEDIINFDSSSERNDGTSIIKEDGYVEIGYGLIPPSKYVETFLLIDTISYTGQIPDSANTGNAYLLISSENDLGTLYIWNGSLYETHVPNYGWSIQEDSIQSNTKLLKSFIDYPQFYDVRTNKNKYREFENIDGLRIVVTTMNKFDSCFELIELSPRLYADITDMVSKYSINKSLSDSTANGLPVGQLLASTGNLSIFDFNQIFNKNNTNSIINEFLDINVKFNFYESIQANNLLRSFNEWIPIKTMYSDSMPQSNVKDATIDIELRDMYFYFESLAAPSLFFTNVSVSFVVSTLLDYVGFSNYVFKSIDGESETIIPFFFCNPDTTIAQVLNDIAISSQYAMFFDEYNNFVMMSKEYMLPKINQRDTSFTLYGNEDSQNNKKENIINISSIDKKIFNDGKINYTTRYVQKSLGSVKQASFMDKDKNWIYKPVLLWEASGKKNTKTMNDATSSMSSYVLSAMPLNSNLSDSVPSVINNSVVNNLLDLGENVYWISNYEGYFYSNGEIIKYDAVEYNIPKIGNVWISNDKEYEYYFSTIPFNGKIYPTGLIRIYSEPDYELINNELRLKSGDILKNGRGQFGTTIATHTAGLNSYWTNNDNVRSCNMYAEYLFQDKELDKTTIIGEAGLDNVIAQQSNRSGIIKNFMSNSYNSEYSKKEILSTSSGSIQSSALVFSGPVFPTDKDSINYITYVNKELNNKFKHFGTRLRIIGKIENNEVRGQTPVGSTTYYVVPGTNPSQNISIGGGSGGIGVLVNPNTNVGYYFEMIALTDTNINSYASESNIANMVFYKILKDSNSTTAVPIKLWSGSSNIIVDDGLFTGQYRMTGEQNSTVYDIAVEYIDVGNIRKFYLYVNNKIIAIVDDNNPLPIYNNMCLFTRGSSKIMFENIFALTSNYSQNTSQEIDLPFNNIFDNQEITSDDAFRKYAMSSVIQSTYLSGLSSNEPPAYSMYFDEFGSIMRECAYMNIKYDKAYPALYAKISPTFNKIKGYTVSGFLPDAYGAEFLLFNATDTVLSLDETSGNYLRIQGVAFTQSTTNTITVDDYYSDKSNFLKYKYLDDATIRSNVKKQDKYNKIKISRTKYGKKEFTLDLPYVQNKQDAESLLGWIVDKTLNPKKSIGLDIFPIPTLQLGDIVNIYYKDKDGKNIFVNENVRFVIYNMSYSRTKDGPLMSIYAMEISDD